MKNEQLKFVIDSRCFCGSCITSMSDGLHSDYGGETLEELKTNEKNPYLIAVSVNTIWKMTRIYEKSLCGPFCEITEEEYYDNMDVLPPIHLKKHSFFIGEPHYGNLYTFCFTIHNRYFKGLRSVKTPQAELEEQMKRHYRHITFHGKIKKGHPSVVKDKEKQEVLITPYFFVHADGKERFLCNLVVKRNDTEDTRPARKNMANTLLSLRKHHFLYFSSCDYDDLEKFLDEVEKKGYTLLANGAFFQFPVNRESASFTGHVKETKETFFFRIYDRELFLHLLCRLRTIKREKTEVKFLKQES